MKKLNPGGTFIKENTTPSSSDIFQKNPSSTLIDNQIGIYENIIERIENLDQLCKEFYLDTQMKYDKEEKFCAQKLKQIERELEEFEAELKQKNLNIFESDEDDQIKSDVENENSSLLKEEQELITDYQEKTNKILSSEEIYNKSDLEKLFLQILSLKNQLYITEKNLQNASNDLDLSLYNKKLALVPENFSRLERALSNLRTNYSAALNEKMKSYQSLSNQLLDENNNLLNQCQYLFESYKQNLIEIVQTLDVFEKIQRKLNLSISSLSDSGIELSKILDGNNFNNTIKLVNEKIKTDLPLYFERDFKVIKDYFEKVGGLRINNTSSERVIKKLKKFFNLLNSTLQDSIFETIDQRWMNTMQKYLTLYKSNISQLNQTTQTPPSMELIKKFTLSLSQFVKSLENLGRLEKMFFQPSYSNIKSIEDNIMALVSRLEVCRNDNLEILEARFSRKKKEMFDQFESDKFKLYALSKKKLLSDQKSYEINTDMTKSENSRKLAITKSKIENYIQNNTNMIRDIIDKINNDNTISSKRKEFINSTFDSNIETLQKLSNVRARILNCSELFSKLNLLENKKRLLVTKLENIKDKFARSSVSLPQESKNKSALSLYKIEFVGARVKLLGDDTKLESGDLLKLSIKVWENTKSSNIRLDEYTNIEDIMFDNVSASQSIFITLSDMIGNVILSDSAKLSEFVDVFNGFKFENENFSLVLDFSIE